jgi:hypothetical protein
LLDHWDINAVIALNSRATGCFSFPAALFIDDNGNPVCPAGNKMRNWGFDHARQRIKFRCPRVLCTGNFDKPCISCSPSAYGRTFYTKPSWDLRLFTRITRGSDDFKSLFKQRTTAERVNNRILNHYNLNFSHARGKKRIAFHALLASVNIHLDAWIAGASEQLDSFFYHIF